MNVFDAKSIDHTILQKMIGQSVFEYSYKRKDMAVTMKCKSSVEHNGEIIPIHNQLLFQRLSFVAARDHTELKSALNYELTTLPASLFNKDGLMKSANKPALAEVIWKIAGSYNPILPDNKKFLLDGGSLLVRNVWKKGETFAEICQRYVDYVVLNFGKDSEVVFDHVQK